MLGNLDIIIAIIACAVVFWLWINYGGGSGA